MRWFPMGSPGFAGKRSATVLILWILVWSLTGCMVLRRQKIPVAAASAAPVWQTASLPELLEKIKVQQDAIQTADLAATIEPSVSSPAKGEIVTYHDVRAFILMRKPSFLRMIGLFPVVQNKAFDMASDGEGFRLYIPTKNRFIIGKSRDGGTRSKSALENLRPQHILDALLINGPEPGKEEAALEAFAEKESSYYIVHILRALPEHGFLLARNIWFERRRLSLVRLQIFDDGGEMVTDVRYSGYAQFSGISYPQEIVVDRPKDLYGLRLSLTKLVFNQPLGNDKFLLEQPPGTELINLDRQSLPEKENKVG